MVDKIGGVRQRVSTLYRWRLGHLRNSVIGRRIHFASLRGLTPVRFVEGFRYEKKFNTVTHEVSALNKSRVLLIYHETAYKMLTIIM